MSALLDHLWQSTLFGLVIWLIVLALGSNRAAVRHALWFAASLKFLVPFALLVLVGEWIGMNPTYGPPGAESTVGQTLQMASPLVAPVAVHTGDAGFMFSWLASLMLVWAAGVLVFAARWLNAWRAARAAVRGAWPVALADDLDVRASAEAGEPAVACIIRPVILVPAGLVDALSREELRVVLAHEREHIARRDNLTNGVHMLVETLFWFHPMVWWIGRRMIDERERACDEAVVDAGYEGRDYAAGILAVCRLCCADRRVAGAISALSGNLPQRIRRIVCEGQPAALGLVKAMALSLAVVALFVVPVTAGAVKDERSRREIYLHDIGVLSAANIVLAPAPDGGVRGGVRGRVIAAERTLRIDNTTMLELLALAYGVDPDRIYGAEALALHRYDIRATLASSLADPQRFDPAALRGVLNELLAARFRFEVYVNRRCQAPCGPQALTLNPR